MGGIAVTIPWHFSDTFFAKQFDGELPEPKPQPPVAEWAKKWQKKLTPMRLADAAFTVFIFLSASTMVGSIAYLAGSMQARYDFYEKNLGAREQLNK